MLYIETFVIHNIYHKLRLLILYFNLDAFKALLQYLRNINVPIQNLTQMRCRAKLFGDRSFAKAALELRNSLSLRILETSPL